MNIERGQVMEEDSISWGELAELTHATQVERFGWCICEDTDGQGQLHDDCPVPTITEELEWCEIELANIKAGLFSMHTREHIEGAISALKLAKEGK
jgi:hypothetical protein